MALYLCCAPLLTYAQEPQTAHTETPTGRPLVAVGQTSPITEQAIWPVKPNKKMAALKGNGNCVKCMRAAGFHVPMGYPQGAGRIPVPVRDIAEGEVAVAVTYEGWVGHVVLVQKVRGKLLAVFECNYFSRKAGDEVPKSVVKGFLPQNDGAVDTLIKSSEPLVKPVPPKLSRQ